MNSFYGGKPGASFVVVKHFDTYEDMVTKFQGGDDYTEVQYDQYVIIGKNDANKQGNIYRRGYLTSENFEEGGAEFICNITGPAGSMSELNFVPYSKIPSDIEIKYDEENPFADTLYIGEFSVDNKNLIPGDESSVIKWKIYNTKSEQGQVKSDIALQIPYPIVDLELETADLDEIAQNPDILGLVKTVINPFHQKWVLTVPEGTATPDVSVIYSEEEDINISSLGPKALAFKVRS